MTHLRETMKSWIEKWDAEIKKEEELVRKAWLVAQRDTLACWLADIEMELSFAQAMITYIPTIKEQ